MDCKVGGFTPYVNTIVDMYKRNFSPHAKISHRLLRKRLKSVYEGITFWTSNTLIGFALIRLYPLIKTVFLDYLCIDEPFRKFGYGKQFLCKDLNELYPMYDNFILECEQNLIGYYQKVGFKPIRLPYSITHFTMMYKGRFDMRHKFIEVGQQFNTMKTVYEEDEVDQWLKQYLSCLYFIYFILLCFTSTHT